MNPPLQFQWQPNVKFLLLVAAVVPLTIFAGFWQLDRAQQKRDLLALQDRAVAMAPVPVQSLEPEAGDDLNYRQVRVAGNWRPEVFLQENRIRAGRVGYEVIAVIEIPGYPLIAVNRGWIQAGRDRTQLPEYGQPQGVADIGGYLYRSPTKSMVLEEQTWAGDWPERLQVVDFELMQARLEQPLFPYLVRIDEAEPLALQAGWTISRKGPGMHIGYAMQWFLMGATVLIMTLFANSNLGRWLRSRKKSG